MTQPTNKTELLAEIERAHQDMVRYLASLTDAEKTAPILDEGWSIKDSLSHLVAWEKLTVDWLERSLQGEHVRRYVPGFIYNSPEEHEPVMLALNQHLYEQTRERALADVVQDFRAAHRAIYDFVTQMEERDIFDPDRFPGREGSPARDMIAGNTYGHYDEHLGWIQISRARLSNYPENKDELVRRVRERHAEMEALLATLTPSQMNAPELDGGWSVKDSLAHLTEWETLLIDWVGKYRRGEEVKRWAEGFLIDEGDAEAQMHRFNAHLYEKNRDLPLDHVLASYREMYAKVVALLTSLSEDEIYNPTHFPAREGRPLITLIVGDSYEHYDEHIGWIRVWLAKNPWQVGVAEFKFK